MFSSTASSSNVVRLFESLLFHHTFSFHCFQLCLQRVLHLLSEVRFLYCLLTFLASPMQLLGEVDQGTGKERLKIHCNSLQRPPCHSLLFFNPCSKVIVNMVYVISNVPRTMDVCTPSEASDDLTARDSFLGKNRSERHFDDDDVDDEDEACLDLAVWSKLPEELLIHIFARLPVKNILQIRSLNKSWRSTITSPQFQQVFSEASLVRFALMISDEVDGTMFFTHKEECFRYFIARCPEVVLNTNIVGTVDGLVCVIEEEYNEYREWIHSIVRIRVFVMNLVTGLRRELPSPRIMTSLPTLVKMETNVRGGYTITFIYTKDREELEVTSWQVYDSLKNTWSRDDGSAMADFKDVNFFNMLPSSTGFYGTVATFHKKTKEINIINLHEENASCDTGTYLSDPNGHVHNVSGEFYKLCTREERHGVWKLVCSSQWEMVCECPNLEGVWTCLRVMNDLVVLVIELPVPYSVSDWYDEADGVVHTCCSHGGIVKVFHMPTKVWHTFPEDEYFITALSFSNRHGIFDEQPFIAEIKFDAIP